MCNKVMNQVNTWMSSHGRELAVSKTKIVMLPRQRILYAVHISDILPSIISSSQISILKSLFLGESMHIHLHILSKIRKLGTPIHRFGGILLD